MYGYNRTEFTIQRAIHSRRGIGFEANIGKALENQDGLYINSYRHNESACYYCSVNATEASITLIDKLKDDHKISPMQHNQRLSSYYKALAREKYNLKKISNYVNNSGDQHN